MKSIAVAALGVGIFCGSAVADTHYVSPQGGAVQPFTTPETAATVIQDAVDAAVYGDVVDVGPGQYRQRVTLKRGIHLWGHGADSTVIIPLEEGWGEAAVTGAEAAEIRGLALARKESDPPTFPTAIRLGPYPDQVVADCTISGDFYVGIDLPGPCHGGGALIYGCVVDGPSKGLRLHGYRPYAFVDACVFRGGASVESRSGSLFMTRCHLLAPLYQMIECSLVSLDSCFISSPAGRINVDGGGSLRVTNCIIWGRQSDVAVNSAESVQIYNCTLVDTSGIYCDASAKVQARNTILWGNAPQLHGVAASSFNLEFCDIKGGWDGEGNIDAEPLFVDPGNGDFRLRPQSPCIDTGRRFLDFWLPATDFAGSWRVRYGGVAAAPDMGAYEYNINLVEPGPRSDELTLIWSSQVFKSYSIYYSDGLSTWHVADGQVVSASDTTTSWVDDGSKTGIAPLLAPRRFYRILENP